ncbi:unnamed protein product [Phytophthora fragariaefolia]|uniref:Unnamed protein product n=1 Tax=Phytophthora fragariaefolia TaxID=1490495 RepID=A0A9W7DAG1_9STRA|nr:unnamed protein product [Phytophthora fragariaefolia]GMF80856.1 unnamed protein product [Phytophthora fragariaefolia]
MVVNCRSRLSFSSTFSSLSKCAHFRSDVVLTSHAEAAGRGGLVVVRGGGVAMVRGCLVAADCGGAAVVRGGDPVEADCGGVGADRDGGATAVWGRVRVTEHGAFLDLDYRGTGKWRSERCATTPPLYRQLMHKAPEVELTYAFRPVLIGR